MRIGSRIRSLYAQLQFNPHPKLAERVHVLLQSAGIAVRIDSERGYDHGMFLPLMVAVGAAGNDAARSVYHEDNFVGGLLRRASCSALHNNSAKTAQKQRLNFLCSDKCSIRMC